MINKNASSGLEGSDLLNLKNFRLQGRIKEVYDDNDEPQKICQLSLERKHTSNSLLSLVKEAVETIEDNWNLKGKTST
ncbi:MAG: hypothetical protein HY802_01070 [Methanobacterium sp.]|nr:hypothetical protein [Methanobacterium sp.]